MTAPDVLSLPKCFDLDYLTFRPLDIFDLDDIESICQVLSSHRTGIFPRLFAANLWVAIPEDGMANWFWKISE